MSGVSRLILCFQLQAVVRAICSRPEGNLTPQGVIISPLLANIALDGLDELLATYWKSSRCQRSRVSGWAMCKACRQNWVQRASSTRHRRSPLFSWGRPVPSGVLTWRLSTMSCWRSIAFSAMRSVLLRVISVSDATTRVAVVGLTYCLIRRRMSKVAGTSQHRCTP